MATTEVLIRKTQQGNLAAREELYRRYWRRVFFRARVRMGPELGARERPSDVAQEAMMRSLAGLQEFVYRFDGAFFAFLADKGAGHSR